MQSLQNNSRVNNYLRTTSHAPIPLRFGIPPETGRHPKLPRRRLRTAELRWRHLPASCLMTSCTSGIRGWRCVLHSLRVCTAIVTSAAVSACERNACRRNATLSFVTVDYVREILPRRSRNCLSPTHEVLVKLRYRSGTIYYYCSLFDSVYTSDSHTCIDLYYMGCYLHARQR